MAWMRAIIRSLVVRQRDGRRWPASCSGGRVPEFRGEVFDEECGDEMCQDPCPGQTFVFGWQAIDAEQALQPLEGELDPPAQSVERAKLVGTGFGAIERGDEHQMA